MSSINQVWKADITYIRIDHSSVYLTVIIDSFSRKVVWYALSNRLDTDVVLAALKMALAGRQQARGCIHHSDQGVQYASHEYIKELKHRGFLISMAQTENTYENAQAESFFINLKIRGGEPMELPDTR